MKKMLLGLLAALLLSSGLVGLATSPAHAEQCDKYGVCVKPKQKTEKDKNVDRGEKPKVKVKMDAPGDAVPEGVVKLIIKPLAGGKAVKQRKKLNDNGAVTITGPGDLACGKYEVTVKFIPKKGTPWKRTEESYTMTVAC